MSESNAMAEMLRNGVFINSEGTAYAVINGSAYELDKTYDVAPGSYTIAELEAAVKQKQVNKYYGENPDERHPEGSGEQGGRFAPRQGGGAGAAETKPSNGRTTGSKAQGADKRVSTAIPSVAASKKQGIEPHKQKDIEPSYDAFNKAIANPKFAAGAEAVLNRYGESFMRFTPDMTLKEKAEAFVEQSKSNIIALYDAYDKYREKAKLWYEGANKIAGDMADKYKVSKEQVSGVIASLSPQRDWDQNVEMAKRVLDIAVLNKDRKFEGKEAANARTAMLSYRNTQAEELKTLKEGLPSLTVQSEINAANKKIKNRETMVRLIDDLSKNFEGKKLGDLPINQQPVMLRFFDSGNAEKSRSYQIWNPDGTSSGKIARNNPTKAQAKRGEEGDPKQSGWGGFDSIGNALSILRNGNNENISKSLGDNHKVRNFYNNIISPNYGQDTTIDTHAVAASTLQPLGQSSRIVKEGLGMSGPKNADTGLKGMYALHYEAYRRAAAEVSKKEGKLVLPREMQSASWEALRGLYSPTEKTDKSTRDANAAIWKRFAEGKISLQAAQKQILERGIKAPRWAS